MDGSHDTTTGPQTPQRRVRSLFLCCDTRRAVLILNVLSLLGTTVYVLLAFVGLFLDKTSSRAQGDERTQLYIMVALSLVLEIPLALLCLWGASNFVLWPIQINYGYLGFKLALTLFLVVVTGIPNAVMYIPGLALLFSAHGGFLSDVERGLLRKETYHQESVYCCCCPSTDHAININTGVEFTAVGQKDSTRSIV